MNPASIDIKDQLLIVLPAQTVAAAVTSAAFDMTFGAQLGQQPYTLGAGGAAIQFQVPITSYNFGTGDETASFKMQQSPDGATWTDASRVATIGAGAPTDLVPPTGGRINLGFFVSQRFVRLVIAVGGTAPSVVLRDCYLEPFINKFAG